MADPSAQIATERLDLAPLRVVDADEMVAVLADPALYVFIGGEPPTLAALIERYRVQVDGLPSEGRETWLNWIVRERSSDAAIGFVQATIREPGDDPDHDDPDRSAEIAWVIGTPWQGHGYATEAARAIVAWLDDDDVRAIVAHVHPDHVASALVAQRAGLEPTEVMVDGERAWRRVR